MAAALVAAATFSAGGCSTSLSGTSAPSSSTASTSGAQPQASLSSDDLARLGRCIAQQGPFAPEDRIDSAKVWATTSAIAQEALKDYVPAFESEPQNAIFVLLQGEFVDQYGLGDGQGTTPQMWFATPTFDTAEDYLPGTGMAACDPDESQAGSPLRGVDEALLGGAQDLPVGLIRGDEPIAGIRSANP
jgi:hypothetical protein